WGAIPQEEVLACGAALQNMLLAAHSLGLGAAVRTGKSAYSREVREYLGLRDEESVSGFVYLGYPDGASPAGRRSGLAAKVEWRES
ncbi:MAG: nitroreductase family protein, partial [Thaumarchaeota archaeon]|nr:nitroreductase family protein [Nitrososphaerota archaeon]